MESPSTTDLTRDLEELSGSEYSSVRRRAADSLGRLPTTGEEIVRALVVAERLDPDPGVRMAAGEALQSPVHRGFLQAHPDFARQVVDAAARAQAQAQQDRQEQIIQEFMRRRSRERTKALVFAGVFTLVWCLPLFLPYEGTLIVLRAYPLVIVLGACLLLWLSWRSWRCPSCDRWLSSWGVAVNPFFSSAPLRCPHCGSRLL